MGDLVACQERISATNLPSHAEAEMARPDEQAPSATSLALVRLFEIESAARVDGAMCACVLVKIRLHRRMQRSSRLPGNIHVVLRGVPTYRAIGVASSARAKVRASRSTQMKCRLEGRPSFRTFSTSYDSASHSVSSCGLQLRLVEIPPHGLYHTVYPTLLISKDESFEP